MGGGSFSEGRGGLLFSQGRRVSKQQKVRDNFIKKSNRVQEKIDSLKKVNDMKKGG